VLFVVDAFIFEKNLVKRWDDLREAGHGYPGKLNKITIETSTN
jgi:hypothetical protein